VSLAGRVAGALALLLAGALIGLAAIALHALWWGLLLSAAASLAVVWALPPRFWTLPPYAVGWWLPFLVAWKGRPEGDYAVESSRYGYGLLVLAVAVLVASMVIAALKAPLRSSPKTQVSAEVRDTEPRGAR
jgi:membrane protease YdiL (CAAX protease family)